jgi:hypothetical protein
MLQVVTPADSFDLTTTEAVVSGWSDASSFDTADIDNAVTVASKFVQAWCKKWFVVQTYKEYLESTFLPQLVLSEYPILDITSITVDGEAVDLGVIEYEGFRGGMVIRTDNKVFAARRYSVGFLHSLSPGRSNFNDIVVDYEAGYSSIPEDLQRAVIVIVRHSLKADKESPAGEIIRTKVGNFETEYQGVDPMSGSGSGYWAESIGDPTIMFIPIEARRILLSYRGFDV